MISESVTGLLVPYGDPDALTLAVRSALFDVRFDMAKGRQLVVDKYSVREISKQLTKLYSSIVYDQTKNEEMD
jgi:glycosyltransferase involved in cell wall biosynthesis